jgi:hypothetical protein
VRHTRPNNAFPGCPSKTGFREAREEVDQYGSRIALRHHFRVLRLCIRGCCPNRRILTARPRARSSRAWRLIWPIITHRLTYMEVTNAADHEEW